MSNRLPWLKHDTDAHQDPWFRHLIRSGGHDHISAYWGLLELLHKYGNGDEFTRNFDDVCAELLIKRVRFRRILAKMAQKWDGKFKVSHKFSGDDLTVEIKNFRHYQDKLTRKMSAKALQTPAKGVLNGATEKKKKKKKKKSREDSISPSGDGPTDIQRIMMQYKELIGVDPKDPVWDKAEFKKWSRSAKKLIGAFGHVNPALDFLVEQGREMTESEIKGWTLAAVASRAHDPRYK